MGCDMAMKAEAANPLMGKNFGKLPCYPCAAVSFLSNQDYECHIMALT
jgi:hypothetical protein